MFDTCALDSDVILKFGRYRAIELLLAVTSFGGTPPAIVAAARFACRQRARRWARADPAVGAAIDDILVCVRLEEPSDDDIALAADLEEAGIRGGLAFDPGESLLFAMAAARPGRLSVTGDKRAITALGTIGQPLLHDRIACFEQLLATIMASGHGGALRAAVCAASEVDRNAAICFQCHSDGPNAPMIIEALTSYIEALRRRVPELLLPGRDWSAEIAQEDRER